MPKEPYQIEYHQLKNNQCYDCHQDSDIEPLSSEKFCNPKWSKKPNPIYGKGALGERLSHMYYREKDKKKWVTIVQRMLKKLGYNLGKFGPFNNGVDGIYGDKTEESIRDFQGNNLGWDGEPLQVDGLVGPKTSDALNAAMVGKLYDQYKTSQELINGKLYFTATVNLLITEGLFIEPNKETEARVILVF